MNIENVSFKDYIKLLDFRLLSEHAIGTMNKWIESLKAKNPQFYHKKMGKITFAEWGKFGKCFDMLGEAEEKTLIYRCYPEHFNEIRTMKDWDTAYCLLDADIERGNELPKWSVLVDKVREKRKEYLYCQ